MVVRENQEICFITVTVQWRLPETLNLSDDHNIVLRTKKREREWQESGERQRGRSKHWQYGLQSKFYLFVTSWLQSLRCFLSLCLNSLIPCELYCCTSLLSKIKILGSLSFSKWKMSEKRYVQVIQYR